MALKLASHVSGQSCGIWSPSESVRKHKNTFLLVTGYFPPSSNSLNLEISYSIHQVSALFWTRYTLFHLILIGLWGPYDFKKGKLRLWEINSQSHKISTKLVCNRFVRFQSLFSQCCVSPQRPYLFSRRPGTSVGETNPSIFPASLESKSPTTFLTWHCSHPGLSHPDSIPLSDSRSIHLTIIQYLLTYMSVNNKANTENPH